MVERIEGTGGGEEHVFGVTPNYERPQLERPRTSRASSSTRSPASTTPSGRPRWRCTANCSSSSPTTCPRRWKQTKAKIEERPGRLRAVSSKRKKAGESRPLSLGRASVSQARWLISAAAAQIGRVARLGGVVGFGQAQQLRRGFGTVGAGMRSQLPIACAPIDCSSMMARASHFGQARCRALDAEGHRMGGDVDGHGGHGPLSAAQALSLASS